MDGGKTAKHSSDRFGFGFARSKQLIIVATLLWAVLVVSGYVFVLTYEGKAGAALPHPANWPAGSTIPNAQHEPTLIMFIHPKCPCSSASITELSILTTRCAGKLKAYAVFVRPETVAAGWEQTDYWRRAAAIPGVTVLVDEAGRESLRFGAVTSGETLLYDARGKLIFSGGITGARAHEGDNQGLDSITAIVLTGDTRCRQTNAFGCALQASGERQTHARGSEK